jgi:release factor glutamine methyltransferase
MATWTIGATLDWTASYFEKHAIPDARLEAELLLSSVLRCPRLTLHLRREDTVPDEKLKAFKKLIIERQKRKPVSYLLGEQEFMGLSFAVDRNTLIPRPETELLVEEAVRLIDAEKKKMAADLGTGSGCIAVSLAKLSSVEKVFACDISMAALEVAHENILRHGQAGKVVPKHGDLLQALIGERLEGRLGLIASNPPYIPDEELAALQPELAYEPRLALAGGIDGLDFYRRIAADAGSYLEPGGLLIMEMNAAKSREIADIVAANGCTVEKIIKDYAGLDRIIEARKEHG